MTSLVDPVAEFVRIKQAYLSARGGTNATGVVGANGQPLMPPSQLVPKTTWGDVQNFGIKFLAWTSNDAVRKCWVKELAKYGHDIDPSLVGPQTAWLTDIQDVAARAYLSTVCGDVYVETASFLRARDAFVASMPTAKVYAMSPTIGAQAMMTQKVQSNEIYPYNEEFWGAGSRYAIARSAAGMVPSNGELFAESVTEAIEELPQTLRNAFRAVTPNIPFPPIPGFGWIGALLTWSLVGFGAYLLWKH